MTAAAPEVQHQSSFFIFQAHFNMIQPKYRSRLWISILNLNTESTSMVDVPVSTTIEMPPSSATTIPPPPITLIQPLQQTPISTPTIFPSTSLQNLPTFDSVFKFEDRVKALEDYFSEFKQANQFVVVVSLIPGIVDTYLANKMNEAVKTVVQLQSDRLRDEAQAENADFINKLDVNIKKIIKEQVKNPPMDQSGGSSEEELEKNVNQQLHPKGGRLKVIMVRSKEGSKSHNMSTGKSAQAEEPIHADQDLEEPAH
ncbi:hypothetical protein Tco_1484356 [Tanacetum coccineum]